MGKVVVIGLDGAPPELLYGKWKDDLPTLQAFRRQGMHGIMQSTIPPSTTIAWGAFASGHDASGLGFYAYTYREGTKTRLYNSSHIRVPRLWNLLSAAGKRVAVLNVPLTYPPTPVNGWMVTDFLTPDASCEYTYPPSFKQELERFLGRPYLFDATEEGLGGYKGTERALLLKKIYEMTDLHLRTLRYMIEQKDWDFLICVLLGTDRMLHTFLSYYDPAHPKYQPGSPFEHALPEFFQYVDRELGKILALLDEDTTVIICSDHGIRPVAGKINLNDWLVREGYLVLLDPPAKPTRFDYSMVDWAKTTAYATGSYQGRVYFNLAGREDQGIVPQEAYQALQEELERKLKAIADPSGRALDTRCFRPQDTFTGPHRDKAPDLFVYFDNLLWGVNNDLGNQGLYSSEDTVGATDGGHSPEGVIMLCGPGIAAGGALGSVPITDIAPFVLDRLAVAVPAELQPKLRRWKHALL